MVFQRPRLPGLRADQRTIHMGNVGVNPVSFRIQKHPINLTVAP